MNMIPRPQRVFMFSPKERKLNEIYYEENLDGRRTQVIDLHGMTKRKAITWCLYFIHIRRVHHRKRSPFKI